MGLLACLGGTLTTALVGFLWVHAPWPSVLAVSFTVFVTGVCHELWVRECG